MTEEYKPLTKDDIRDPDDFFGKVVHINYLKSALQGLLDKEFFIYLDSEERCRTCKADVAVLSQEGRCIKCEIKYWLGAVLEK